MYQFLRLENRLLSNPQKTESKAKWLLQAISSEENIQKNLQKISDFLIIQRIVGISKKELDSLINSKKTYEREMKRPQSKQKSKQKQNYSHLIFDYVTLLENCFDKKKKLDRWSMITVDDGWGFKYSILLRMAPYRKMFSGDESSPRTRTPPHIHTTRNISKNTKNYFTYMLFSNRSFCLSLSLLQWH